MARPEGESSLIRTVCALLASAVLAARPASAQTLSLLDVPYLTQSEALCGGAAAAMVLRYWGAQGLTAESFASLVDESAAGIRTDVLTQNLVARGWNAVGGEATESLVSAELAAGRPVIALLEDRPGTFHYVVIVGWHPRGVVLHDPARVPYRVMSVDEFTRRWRAARQWTLRVAPREATVTGVPPSVRTAPRPSELSCEALVARGVGEAQSGALDAAERTLSSALSCPGDAALRELAGVRTLQRRWPEAIELASRAVQQQPDDTYAWQVLATSRFVTGDARGALQAWNVAGEPRLDLIQTDGLRRTRQRVLERLVPLVDGDLLSLERLVRAERQLNDWRAMTQGDITYVPRPGGLADLRVSVGERSRIPRSPIALGVIGARAIVMREVRVPFGPLTTGGDHVEVGWRFWPGRPRYSASLQSPAPWGGLWTVQVSSETQPLTTPALRTFRHDSAGLALEAWQRGWLHWQAGGGIDRWLDRGRLPTVHGAVEVATFGDGLRVRARWQSWLGDASFAAQELQVRGTRTRGPLTLESRGAVSRVSRATPYDLWPAGDTGHARPTLMRAHPLVTHGHYRSSRLGATVVSASLEAQYSWQRRGLQFGPAVFADLGRTSRRVEGAALRDADVGAGLRLRVPGMEGAVRIDAAVGLRDGARALSFVYGAP